MQDLEQQQQWQRQLGVGESGGETGIPALHAPSSLAPSAQASLSFPQMQPGLKRWPAVQSNPLYQQAAAEAIPTPVSTATHAGKMTLG